jgi:hypothetical protein
MASWSEEIVSLIRVLIYDLDDTNQRYADARLKQVAIAAAQILIGDVSFNIEYSIDFRTQEVTPNPSAEETRDNDFLNLAALKAACIISIAEARQASVGGISVADGINKFSSSDKVKGMLELAKNGYCSQYKESKDDFSIAAGVIGLAVLSPFNTGYYNSYRGRMRDGIF